MPNFKLLCPLWLSTLFLTSLTASAQTTGWKAKAYLSMSWDEIAADRERYGRALNVRIRELEEVGLELGALQLSVRSALRLTDRSEDELRGMPFPIFSTAFMEWRCSAYVSSPIQGVTFEWNHTPSVFG